MRRTARNRHCADACLRLSSLEAARGRRSAKSSREHTQGYAEPSLLKRACFYRAGTILCGVPGTVGLVVKPKCMQWFLTKRTL